MGEKSILRKCWRFSISMCVDSKRLGLLEQNLVFAIFPTQTAKKLTKYLHILKIQFSYYTIMTKIKNERLTILIMPIVAKSKEQMRPS